MVETSRRPHGTTPADGWWILLHIVLFVFWLGGDLGVFYSSRFVLKPDLTPAARATALKIMGGLDLGPKICLVLFLPSGLTLMALDPHGARARSVSTLVRWRIVVLAGCSRSAGWPDDRPTTTARASTRGSRGRTGRSGSR